MFDPAQFQLKQWEVTDPQGNETLVSLFNMDLQQHARSSGFQDHPDRLLEHQQPDAQPEQLTGRGTAFFCRPAPCRPTPRFLFLRLESDTAGLTNSPRSVMPASPDPSRQVSLHGASDLEVGRPIFCADCTHKICDWRGVSLRQSPRVQSPRTSRSRTEIAVDRRHLEYQFRPAADRSRRQIPGRTTRPTFSVCRRRNAGTASFRLRRSASSATSIIAINGQKGYHGVAIVSKTSVRASIDRRPFCDKGDARHVSVTLRADQWPRIDPA